MAVPKRTVVSTEEAPWLQKLLKKTGKKPAIMVVEKLELAQSYMDQLKIFLSFVMIYLQLKIKKCHVLFTARNHNVGFSTNF